MTASARLPLEDVAGDRAELEDVAGDRAELEDVAGDRAELEDVAGDRAELEELEPHSPAWHEALKRNPLAFAMHTGFRGVFDLGAAAGSPRDLFNCSCKTTIALKAVGIPSAELPRRRRGSVRR